MKNAVQDAHEDIRRTLRLLQKLIKAVKLIPGHVHDGHSLLCQFVDDLPRTDLTHVAMAAELIPIKATFFSISADYFTPILPSTKIERSTIIPKIK